MSRLAVLVFILLMTGCGVVSVVDEEVQLGDVFDLREKQCAGVEGLTFRLHFVEVLSDNRCPEDVECITAGEARIRVQVFPEDEVDPVETVLELNAYTDATSGGPYESEVIGGRRITLLQLDPYPLPSGERDGVPFVATFRLE